MSVLVAIFDPVEVLPPLPESADPLRRLVQQFRGKPRIEALLLAIAAQSQALRETYEDLRTDRWIDTAEGAQLDGLGRILGMSRGALSDEEFRARLRVRIRVLLADGTPESIIATLALLAEGAPVQLVESFPAELRIVMGAAVSPEAEGALRETAVAVKPPGVSLWVETGGDPDEPEFAFDGGSNGAGFGVGVLRGVIHG